MCYALRIDKVAGYAKENGFDAFTTTLLVVRIKSMSLLLNFQKELGKVRHRVFYKDFRPGFRQGQQEAKELGLYRQKYCGCIISYREAEKLKSERKSK